MSQQDVYKYLKSNPKEWFSVKEIATALKDINSQSVTINCNKLRKFGFVDYRRSKKVGAGYNQFEYKYRKPVRVGVLGVRERKS